MARILVVDATPMTEQLVSLTLGMAGHEVRGAENGLQGIALAKEWLPDLVMMDVMMPELDGHQAPRALRAHPPTALVPIIVITAQDTLSEKMAAFEAGADDTMTKPFEPLELQARLDVHLKRAQRSAVGALPAAARQVVACFSLRVGSLNHCPRPVGCPGTVVKATGGAARSGPGRRPRRPAAQPAGPAHLGQSCGYQTRRHRRGDARAAAGPASKRGALAVLAGSGAGCRSGDGRTYPGVTGPGAVALRLDRGGSAARFSRHDAGGARPRRHDPGPFAPEPASIRSVAAAPGCFQALELAPKKARLILNWVFPRSPLPQAEIE